MNDLKRVFIQNRPLIDVRAPIEFQAGHFPHSHNLPLMNDEERKQVGTRYKEAGQSEALKLGHELVTGPLREERIQQWVNFIAAHPDALLYCFRGGLRSQISCSWIRERGIEIAFIEGGYKALRNVLIETLESESLGRSFLILGGRTGVGKTEILHRSMLPFLDLERAANHKGSSFGILGPQPSQITFENRIAVELLQIQKGSSVLIEDESIMIGSAIIPRTLFQKMSESPLIVVEKSIEERALNIVRGYVFERTEAFGGDFEQTRLFMRAALQRIGKKLGGLNETRIRIEIDEAFSSPETTKPETHLPWVQSLLKHYYDPLYDRSLKRNQARIAFQGNETECLQFLREKK